MAFICLLGYVCLTCETSPLLIPYSSGGVPDGYNMTLFDPRKIGIKLVLNDGKIQKGGGGGFPFFFFFFFFIFFFFFFFFPPPPHSNF